MRDPHRFRRQYGLPAGRPTITNEPRDHLYKVEKALHGGALNDGVFLVRHTKTGKRVVQKCIPTDPKMVFMLERELLLLEVLKHPHVVEFVDACITDNIPRQMTMYMEYYDVGSLQHIILRYLSHNEKEGDQNSVGVPEAFVWHVLHSLSCGLRYLHYGIEADERRDPPRRKSAAEWPPILHRDIKPDNILLRTAPGALSSDNDPSQPLLYPHTPYNRKDPEGSHRTYPKVVLADFGVATQYNESDYDNRGGFIATPVFSPPELPQTSGRGDVWAMGASVLCLCRLYKDGPLPPPPPNHPNRKGWWTDPESRRRVAHVGPGKQYSGDLELALRSSLRFNREDRSSSWEVLQTVRRAEKEMFGPGGWGLKVRPLPSWAYKD